MKAISERLQGGLDSLFVSALFGLARLFGRTPGLDASQDVSEADGWGGA